MTDDNTHAETFESGIAVLAEDEPTWEDGPFPVRGVALSEDMIPNSGKTEGDIQTYWGAEVVQAAAPKFDGAKIVDGSEHDPETVSEVLQPSPETIIGEITDVSYKPGVGVLYEGEIDDPEIAKRVDRGRVDVSPTLFRDIAEEPNDEGVYPVTGVKAVRDLSVVATGAAENNSIEPAAQAATAMAAEVLHATFDAETQTTTGAESPADGATNGDDGHSDATGQSTVGPADTETMSDEDNLTDDQRKLLAAAETLDDPTVVEGEHVEVLEAAAGCEEPYVVEQTDYEALQEDLGEAKGVFAEVLAERSGMKAETLSALPWSELRGEFEDDDGKLAAETLRQEPEGGQPETDGTDEGANAEVLEKWELDDRDEAVEVLRNRHAELTQVGWENQAEEIAEDLEALGAEV